MMLRSFLLLAALVFLAACSGDDMPETDAVVATVDGLDLRADDFTRSYLDYLISTGQNDTPANRERHFQALVDAYLLGAEAERRGLDQDSAFVAESEAARRRLVGARYYESLVLDTLSAPTEEEVQRAFALGREQRVLRQLYFTDARAAEAAFERMRAGASFEEEARTLYATDDSMAGSLGAVSYWELDDSFAEAAFSAPVGSITPPVRSRLGWHIISVDDRFRNPLLTETEFQTRRQGVESQLRLRRRRMEGDALVREFMEARGVAVNREALLSLIDAIREAGPLMDDAQQGDARFSVQEKQFVSERLSPQTPLATFEWAGERRVFTVADYLSWVDVLPAGEARSRTGASLGRALRNEALALAGEAAGIAGQADVRHELARMQRLRLADVLRERLREEVPADTARLGEIAEAIGLQSQRTLVSYWVVPFASRAEADAALPRLRRTPSEAPLLPGYEEYREQPLSDAAERGAALRGAPLGRPVLAAQGDAWIVLRVSDRRNVSTDSGAEALAPFAAEAELIKQLRANRPVNLNERALEKLNRAQH